MSDWKEEIRHRLASLQLDPAREAEIVEELAQHLDDRYAELRAGGATHAEAARAALEDLRNSELLAEEVRQIEQQLGFEPVVLGARRKSMIPDLWQDLRYAMRSLRKHAVLSSGMRPVIVGLLIGLAITLGTTSTVAEVFRNGSFREFTQYIHDPITYAIAAILLAAAALSAMLVPARRATRVDPMAVLRCG